MRAVLTHFPLYNYRIGPSEVQDLLNIVNRAIKHSLDIHLDPFSQSESVHRLADSNVAENRFYNSQPPTVGSWFIVSAFYSLYFANSQRQT